MKIRIAFILATIALILSGQTPAHAKLSDPPITAQAQFTNVYNMEGAPVRVYWRDTDGNKHSVKLVECITFPDCPVTASSNFKYWGKKVFFSSIYKVKPIKDKRCAFVGGTGIEDGHYLVDQPNKTYKVNHINTTIRWKSSVGCKKRDDYRGVLPRSW